MTDSDRTNDTTAEAAPDTAAGDTTIDDQFRGLLEGLRTSLPGVQVLFAFLLTAPLSSRFSDLGNHDRAAFSVAFYSAGLSSILLIAPSVHQRVRAPMTGLPRQSKRHLVLSTWVVNAGSVLMGVALVATTYLVSRLLYADGPAMIATALVAAALVWAWFYLPLVNFQRRS